MSRTCRHIPEAAHVRVRGMRVDRAHARITMSLPASAVRVSGKQQTRLYRLSGGRLGGKCARQPVLLLTTIGRRSGQPRSTVVLYTVDGENIVVIGSNAGNEREPAWALNLLANPDAEVQIRRENRLVRARVAEGDERTELWSRMNDGYRGFDDYRERTSREITLFVLEPR
jgi:deazaflavin-dependent oxidoreductase (nitroreductase family)